MPIGRMMGTLRFAHPLILGYRVGCGEPANRTDSHTSAANDAVRRLTTSYVRGLVFSRIMLANSSPCSRASSRATWLCG